MTQQVVETVDQIEAVVSELQRRLNSRKMPVTITVRAGKPKSNEQNRLQRLWVNEAAEQLGDETAEDKRGYCKLHFGVPILRNRPDDTSFQEEYDAVIKPLPYESKLKLMKVPFDFGVTRLMTSKEKTQYLNSVWDFFNDLGVRLTDPREIAK